MGRMTPAEPVTYDREMAETVLRYAVMAADMEALEPRPVSKIRNPDGSVQGETGAEFTRRLVRAAVLHLLENGLVVLAPDAEERMEQGIPMRAPRY